MVVVVWNKVDDDRNCCGDMLLNITSSDNANMSTELHASKGMISASKTSHDCSQHEVFGVMACHYYRALLNISESCYRRCIGYSGQIAWNVRIMHALWTNPLASTQLRSGLLAWSIDQVNTKSSVGALTDILLQWLRGPTLRNVTHSPVRPSVRHYAPVHISAESGRFFMPKSPAVYNE